MKRKIQILLALFLAVLCINGCSSKPSSVEVREGVNFSLMDVLKVENKTANTVFYYFLAGIENNSDTVYHMSNLQYIMTSEGNETGEGLAPIDQYKSIITNDVQPGQSTFIYGYIGVPKTNSGDLGLLVQSENVFLPFDSIKVRTIDDNKVVNSDEEKFTIYEDGYFAFDVDASNTVYSYADGVSTVTGLTITYTNKTENRLVVPYLTPVCTIDGLVLSSLSNGDELKTKTLEELKQMDFSSNGLDAKTESVKAETLGYKLYYLPAGQSVTVQIICQADGVIPDFSSSRTDAITIKINSPALGYSQEIQIPY
jgi:hypothetical protein